MLSISEIINIIGIIKKDNNIKENSPLYGSNAILDSLNFIELCISLEDKSNELGFTFEWNTEKTINRIDEIFKNPRTLTIEFNNQMHNSKTL
tara:strand:+ start:40 stop:315 length:276 start_codon:yes stop_codon:yes gene_type:complete